MNISLFIFLCIHFIGALFSGWLLLVTIPFHLILFPADILGFCGRVIDYLDDKYQNK
jgi:hypothetical protein